jgi:hypothetical protein
MIDCDVNKRLGTIKKKISSIKGTGNIYRKHPGNRKKQELEQYLEEYDKLIDSLNIAQLIDYYKHSNHFEKKPVATTVDILFTKLSAHENAKQRISLYKPNTTEIKLLFVKTALEFLWLEQVRGQPRVHTTKCKERIVFMCGHAGVDPIIWLLEE